MNRTERNLYELYFKKIAIEHIREARISKGWTQAKLAEAIDVSHEFIRSLESLKGKNSFSAFTAWRISKVLFLSFLLVFLCSSNLILLLLYLLTFLHEV